MFLPDAVALYCFSVVVYCWLNIQPASSDGKFRAMSWFWVSIFSALVLVSVLKVYCLGHGLMPNVLVSYLETKTVSSWHLLFTPVACISLVPMMMAGVLNISFYCPLTSIYTRSVAGMCLADTFVKFVLGVWQALAVFDFHILQQLLLPFLIYHWAYKMISRCISDWPWDGRDSCFNFMLAQTCCHKNDAGWIRFCLF